MKTAFTIAILLCVAVAIVLYWRRPKVIIRQPHLTFPNDENGDILRQMQAAGDNLDASRDINYSFAFETQDQAERFVAAVMSSGFQAEASPYPERKMWQAEVTHHMLPTHVAITELEAHLTEVASYYNGEADGWGCFIQP